MLLPLCPVDSLVVVLMVVVVMVSVVGNCCTLVAMVFKQSFKVSKQTFQVVNKIKRFAGEKRF